jgi:putative ABC transport system permease protein
MGDQKTMCGERPVRLRTPSGAFEQQNGPNNVIYGIHVTGTDVVLPARPKFYFMFKNYLKTALRNLQRQRANALINISGLTLGIACSLLLFLMVRYQSSFDQYHSKKDRIYRLVHQSDGNRGNTDYQAGVQAVLPEAVRTDFPEAEQVVFTSYRSDALVTVPQRQGEAKKYQEERGVVYTESNFFDVFDRGVLMGTVAHSLDKPNEAIISKGLAKKYFGREDVLGEVVRFEDLDYKINAVVENAPPNSDLPFDLFLSYVSIKKRSEAEGWNSIWSDEQCYVLMKAGEDVNKASARFPDFIKKYQGDNDRHLAYAFQPLAEMHHDDRYSNYSYNTVAKGMIITLGAIAAILIITACINFINLSTAEAIKRSKEVGIRKTLGSSRGQLIYQFLGETTFVTLTSVVLALALTQLALGFINPYLEVSLALDLRHDLSLWGYLIAVTVSVSLLSGLYPAFVISGFRPALALKNQTTARGTSGYMLRRGLVVLQFCISQFFIIGTIVIISQMNYFRSKDLGFNREAILIAPLPYMEDVKLRQQTIQKNRTLRDAMTRTAGVETASLANTPPSSSSTSNTNFTIAGVEGEFRAQVKQVDGNYMGLFQLPLVAGKNLEDYDTARGYVVNEKLARLAGFNDPKEIVGREMTLWGGKWPVVGVVKDFHTVSLHRPIEATVLFNRAQGYESLALKVDLSQAKDVIKALQAQWEAAYPQYLFEYQFLDDNIAEFYESEQRTSVLMTFFTCMAVFIGCLGLFGLATFMTNQRTKEIGVRKVLGATVESIVFMFSKEFLKLVGLGFLLAAPLAWWMMDQFLSEFEYKIDLGPALFLAGFGVAIFIAISTVAYKSITAATRNPVQSLRYE